MFSVTVLIEMIKRNVVGKYLLHFTDYCELWREVREGTQGRQTLEQRSFFRLDLGVHYLSYSAPVHLPKNSAAQSGLRPPPSISTHGNALQMYPQANVMELIPQLRIPQMSLRCVKLTVESN